MSDVWSRPLVFIDIETTGGSHFTSRVLEVGLVRVEQGVVVATYKQLLDPGEPVPSFITSLTGITTEDTQGCPAFRDIAAELADLMEGAIFVAHNARFDYGFLKMEFERLGTAFHPPLLCTVRLSRRLFPQFRSHKLAALIERHGLVAPQRHRAYDDAHCLWQFFMLCLREFDLDTIDEAMRVQLQTQSIPSQLDRAQVEGLPEGPGVYIFEGEDRSPLYVGKSVNVRKRVLSHFSADYERGVEEKLARQVKRLHGIATHGELGALLLESELVKTLQPMYNRKLRQQRQMVLALAGSDERGYATVSLMTAGAITAEQGQNLLGIYTTKTHAVSSLRAVCTQFRMCAKLMGLERTKRACFLSQLGKCDGACIGLEDASSYNHRFGVAFENRRVAAWPYDGPISICERDNALGGAVRYTVDDWCLVSKQTEADNGTTVVEDMERHFDMDTYKIVRQFLSNPRNHRLIEPAWAGV